MLMERETTLMTTSLIRVDQTSNMSHALNISQMMFNIILMVNSFVSL